MTADPYAGMTRATVIRRWLDTLQREMGSQKVARCLEVGRARNPIEFKGHSTLHIVAHPVTLQLLSLDIQAPTQGVTRCIIPTPHLPKLVMVDADAEKWLVQDAAKVYRPFDFCYLDGPNESERSFAVFAIMRAACRPGALIIVDDTGTPNTHRGDDILPWVRENPGKARLLETIPRDKTCNGMSVIRVLDPK